MDSARARSDPRIHYAVASAWDALALLELDPCVDVLFLDVGGISSADGLHEALTLCRLLLRWAPVCRLLLNCVPVRT